MASAAQIAAAQRLADEMAAQCYPPADDEDSDDGHGDFDEALASRQCPAESVK